MTTYCPHNPPMHSPGVAEMQQALAHAGFYKGRIDGIYSGATADAARRAKYALGYPAPQVDHCAGDRLFAFLTGKKRLPPAYVLLRHKRGFGLSRWQKTRDAIVAWAEWGVRNEPSIHYGQIRPIPHKPVLPMTTDCSGFVTLCYQLAGAPDPNGLAYDGKGWTGTLLSHCEHIALVQAEPADLVVWGVYPGHHVAVITGVTDRRNPDLVSHGAERGPLRVTLAEETQAQAGRPYAVLRAIPVK